VEREELRRLRSEVRTLGMERDLLKNSSLLRPRRRSESVSPIHATPWPSEVLGWIARDPAVVAARCSPRTLGRGQFARRFCTAGADVHFPDVEEVVLVMDQPNIRTPRSL
jgi:hypothetical protein